MSSISYYHNSNDDYVTEQVDTETQIAELYGHIPYLQLQAIPTDGSLINDGSATETVTVKAINGLEVARGTDPSSATVLNYDGNVTLTVDGVETTKTLASGTTEFNLTTGKTAGSTIIIEALSVEGVPAGNATAEIEVIQ